MQIASDAGLALEEDAGILTIRIETEGEQNRLSAAGLSALERIGGELQQRDDINVVVLTGAGSRFFCTGILNPVLRASMAKDDVIALVRLANRAFDALEAAPQIVIAALNGELRAGGAELALACDMRMQGARARIGYIQAKLAITSAWGGGPDLFRLVGPAHAMRMMSRCELVPAEQALAWGLADVVVSDGPAGQDIAAFTKPLLACAPQVLRGIKAQAIAWRQGLSWQAHRAAEQKHLVRTWLHDDHWAASEKLLSRGS